MCAPRLSSISTTLLNTSVCIVGRSPSSVPSVLSASHTLGPTASTWTTATHIASHTENSYASQALASEEQALSSTGKWLFVLYIMAKRNMCFMSVVITVVFLKIQVFQNITLFYWINSSRCPNDHSPYNSPEDLNLRCKVIQREGYINRWKYYWL